MVLLENDTFLLELTKLFQSNRAKGAVSLTMKRYDGRTKPKPKNTQTEKPVKTSTSSEYMCLLRAKSTRSKKKISTVVRQKDTVKFQIAYLSLLRNSFDGLKKARKVKQREKSKVQ